MLRRSTSPFDRLSKPPEPRGVTSLDGASATLAEALSLPEPTVIDLVPPVQRNNHTYFRGASLLAMAYNLMAHEMLNTTNDLGEPEMHFFDGPARHACAENVARAIARGEGCSTTQVRPEMLESLGQVACQRITYPPAVIFALHPSLNDYMLAPSDKGSREGVVWHGPVGVDMVDDNTRELLERIVR